ncbi:adenylate/guanylate cyclase domain-containing protein [Nocardia jejuensis]|uniref:adenylate/guanylate cyclase domain-containing protein n=1 Tax=Nocardia jejuensis TaxID=328049 RepID=UPI00083372FF|nr:adenylate/guanylate cyclase domain-containing protein [Nocardia jejuensis]
MVDLDVAREALDPTPWGSRLLGTTAEQSGVRRIRIQLLLTSSIVVTNCFGIALVVVLVGFVLPGPPLFTKELLTLNFVVFPLYAFLAVVIGVVWGTGWCLRTLHWAIDPDRVPDEAEQAATTSVPAHLVIVEAALWFGGLVLMTPLYGHADRGLIAKVILGIVFGAIVVCANSFLAAEFALRPVTARVLDAAESQRHQGIGVFGRSVLAWILGTAAPVTLSMIVAVLALLEPTVSTARLAACVLVLGATTLVFGIVLMTQALSAALAPIRSVRRALHRVEDGDLTARVTVFDGTELGELQNGFNRMVQRVRDRDRIQDLFGRHVGHDVAAAAITQEPELGGQECSAAALFVDIIGSTTMTATRPATEVVEILNRFFDLVVDEVERHGGLLNKFEGDAALAIFGAPAPLECAENAALACARAIQRRLSASATDFTAGIGVAAGRVVAGNIGARNRYEFTVIGDAVNEAARLCELAKHDRSRVLASAAILGAAHSEEGEHWCLGESVMLRGRVEPTVLARPRTTMYRA